MDEHCVGARGFEDDPHPEQHVAGDVEKRLARLHDVEVVVGHHAERAEHLVEHLAMLTRDTHDDLEVLCAGLQLIHERTHLDGLRARAEDEHDLL